MKQMKQFAAILASGILAGALTAADGPVPAQIEFNRDVRPILSENCFFCHGPDKNKRQADLRLDTPDGLFGTAGHPGVVKPKHPDQSEFMTRLTTPDPEQRMPPVDSGKNLTPRDIAILKKWIEQGAGFEGHWSFQPIRRVTPPEVQGPQPPGFVKNPIDQFVLDELSKQGLQPSPEADRITLIRRLSFDLTGLPPSVTDV